MSGAELLAAAALAATAFVATSFDNLLILVGLLGHPAYSKRDVTSGYLVAVPLVIGLAAALSVVAHRAPVQFLAYLGLIPIGHGLQMLPPGRRRADERGPHTTGGAAAVAIVTIAASGDSLVTFAALLSDSEPHLALPIVATLGLCASGWLALAGYLVSHLGVAGVLRRTGPYLIPLLLIAIGSYILLDTPTDVVGTR